MSLESRPYTDPTLLHIREAISSMGGGAAMPLDVLLPEAPDHSPHSGALCHEVAADQELVRLTLELESATSASSGHMTRDEATKFQAEVWRSDVWHDMVSRVLRHYGSDSEAISPNPFRPQVVFDWGGLRVSLSFFNLTTQVQAWDRRLTDEVGMQDAENYLGMLDAGDRGLYDEARLREFVEARGMRVFRLMSRNPLLTIPAALHILERSTADSSASELEELSKTDGEMWVTEPGAIQAVSGTLWQITDEGTIAELPGQDA